MRVSEYTSPTMDSLSKQKKLSELVEKSFRKFPNNIPAAEEHLFQQVIKNTDIVEMVLRSALSARMRSFADAYWNERTKNKNTTTFTAKQITAEREKAIRESRIKTASNYFNNLKLPDGRHIGEVYWRELPTLIREHKKKTKDNLTLWLTISTIYEHAPSADPNLQVKEVISRKKAKEMMEQVEQRLKEILDERS